MTRSRSAVLAVWYLAGVCFSAAAVDPWLSAIGASGVERLPLGSAALLSPGGQDLLELWRTVQAALLRGSRQVAVWYVAFWFVVPALNVAWLAAIDRTRSRGSVGLLRWTSRRYPAALSLSAVCWLVRALGLLALFSMEPFIASWVPRDHEWGHEAVAGSLALAGLVGWVLSGVLRDVGYVRLSILGEGSRGAPRRSLPVRGARVVTLVLVASGWLVVGAAATLLATLATFPLARGPATATRSVLLLALPSIAWATQLACRALWLRWLAGFEAPCSTPQPLPAPYPSAQGSAGESSPHA